VRTFVTLLRRELWEHPAIYLGPLVVAGLLTLCSVLVTVHGIGTGEGLQILIHGLDVTDDGLREGGLTIAFALATPVFLLVVAAVMSFYVLDCLYAERRDRSILFFKSLPVTDLETVLSKVVTAVLVSPAIGVAVLMGTQLLILVLASVFLLIGQGHPGQLWAFGPLLEGWVLAGYAALVLPLWYAPFIGYFLAVSAWARRAVFLWALAPLLAAQIEYLLSGQSVVGRVVLERLEGFWQAAFSRGFRITVDGDRPLPAMETEGLETLDLDLLSLIDPVGFLANPSVWIGLIVATGFVAFAVFLRRYRDET